MSGSSQSVEISKISGACRTAETDCVAAEEPLEIRIAYSTPDGRATRSVSITMRTPGNDDELAAGFLFTESIIGSAADIAAIETCGPPAPDTGHQNVIRAELAADVAVDHALRSGDLTQAKQLILGGNIQRLLRPILTAKGMTS